MFRVDDTQWARILACACNESQDRMFERLVSTRMPGRAPTSTFLHPRAYAFLDRAARRIRPRKSSVF